MPEGLAYRIWPAQKRREASQYQQEFSYLWDSYVIRDGYQFNEEDPFNQEIIDYYRKAYEYQKSFSP